MEKIYKSEENHLGQVIQHAFITMPASAIPQTKIRRGIPMLFSKTIRQIGV